MFLNFFSLCFSLLVYSSLFNFKYTEWQIRTSSIDWFSPTCVYYEVITFFTKGRLCTPQALCALALWDICLVSVACPRSYLTPEYGHFCWQHGLITYPHTSSEQCFKTKSERLWTYLFLRCFKSKNCREKI